MSKDNLKKKNKSPKAESQTGSEDRPKIKVKLVYENLIRAESNTAHKNNDKNVNNSEEK